MIEETILAYLKEKLGGISVFMELPPDLPSKFVVIDKTGGWMENQIKHSTFAIQSYDATKFETASLNEKIKEVMLNMITLTEVSAVRLNSDYPFTDVSKKRYRYQAVFDITHY